MSEGNRRLVLAVGVVGFLAFAIAWLTFPSIPHLDQFHYGDARSVSYRPGGRQCEPTALAATRNSKVGLDRAENCQKQAEEYRQSSDDLIQQTRAANAAEAQAKIASQGLWTAWFQTIGGFITLAAAIAAAIFARDAAKEGRRSADEAERSRESFVERERAHLNFTYASAHREDGKLTIVFNLTNQGTGLAEIDAMAIVFTDEPVWPATEPDLGESLQVKVAGDTNGQVVHRAMPIRFPATASGYVRYTTLTLADRRAHFCFAIEQTDEGSAYGQEFVVTNLPYAGLPNDT